MAKGGWVPARNPPLNPGNRVFVPENSHLKLSVGREIRGLCFSLGVGKFAQKAPAASSPPSEITGASPAETRIKLWKNCRWHPISISLFLVFWNHAGVSLGCTTSRTLPHRSGQQGQAGVPDNTQRCPWLEGTP